MKNTFKKAIASVMAVASLTMSIAGINASAGDGSGYFNDNIGTVKKTLSVQSTALYATTSADHYSYKTVSIDGYSSSAGWGYSVSTQYFVSGVSKASSTHSSNGVYSYLTVWA